MKSFKVALLLALIALISQIKSDVVEEEGVLVLNEENFDSVISSYDRILVDFYSPRCGHCKILAPEYAKAAQTLAKESPRLYLAKVDVTVEKKLGQRFDIQSYPTIVLFTNGIASYYYGGRTEADIVAWMRSKSLSPCKLLKTPEEVEALQVSNDVVLVLFSTEEDLLYIYEKIAREKKDILFTYCPTTACLEAYKVREGAIILFKKFDEGRSELAEFDEASLKSFIEANSSPLVLPFDLKCAQNTLGKSVPTLILIRDKSSEKSRQLEAILISVAKKIQGKITVVISDIKEEIETELADYLGIKANDLPIVLIHESKFKKFLMNGAITEDTILSFVEDWEKGNLKSVLKSEEIPAKQNENVYVLVGKTFDTIVMDSTKDVLVQFYIPTCQHCQNLAPIYEDLAKSLKHNNNLVIAKIHASANEVENIEIISVPDIKFWPADNKNNPIEFKGEKTLEGLTRFLKEHATNPLQAKEDL